MALPLTTCYVDIKTGQLLDGIGGLSAGPLVLSQGDIITLPIGFCNDATDKGDLVTGTGTAVIYTTLRAAVGGALLAASSSYTYSTPIASIELNLNTTELDTYFENTVPGVYARMRFEIRVTLAGQVRAYYSADVTVLRSTYWEGGTPSASVAGGWVPAFTTQEELLALTTVGTATGVILQGTLSGAFVSVQLTAGSQSTGSGYYRPADYNASSNQRVWVQLQ